MFIIILQVFGLTVNASDIRYKAMLDNRDTITINITDTIYFGDGGYHAYGFDIPDDLLEVGLNYDSLFLTTEAGDDSIVCLELYVAPTYDITLYDSICFGEDYDGYNFHLVEPEVVMHNEVQTLTTALGCDSIVSLSLYVTPAPQGIEKTTEIKANAYPNPSNGIVNVEADGIEVINILGATGVVMKSYKFEGESLVTIDISDMPNSIYVLEIVTRDGRCIRRVIKDL